MEITFLGVVFAVIIVLLAIGRPLYQAIAGGMIVTAGLFHIPVTVIVTKIASVIINWSSLSCFIVFVSDHIFTEDIRVTQPDSSGTTGSERYFS
ncbi:MAG: hypothetical protein ACLRRJ_00550 [Clostridium sp.]